MLLEGRASHVFDQEKARLIRSKLAAWFAVAGRTLPWRTDSTPYAVLVSEFMLQQTQVVTVIPFFFRWMKRFPTLADLAEAPESDVLHAWQGLGYYSRAKNLHKLAQVVLNQFEGCVPSDPSLLRTLPGVGAYSAGAVASFAFDRATAAVDANIARVLARLANVNVPVDSPAGSRRIWELAESLLPENGGGRAHNSALMELGALVCIAKNPKCLECPVREECEAVDPGDLPVKSPRKATVSVEERAAWMVRNAAIVLEQQRGRRAGGLWKLPPLKNAVEAAPLFETVYPFTHHKVTLRVFETDAPEVLAENQRWFALESVFDEAALPAGHLRALRSLLKSEASGLS